MPDEERERYLEQLDALLPLPPERRGEILEEIAAHLEDSVAERVERGEPRDAAERAAQDRLGRPIDLARDLVRPEQSARRLFAGVGSALVSGLGNGLYGYLFGLLLVLVGSIGLSAMVQAAGMLLGTDWHLLVSDQGWNSMLTTIAVAVGLYWAGRVLPDRVARGTGYLVRDVRPWVVGIATLGTLAFTTLVIDGPQNWASVVALILAPAAIGLGAYRPNLLPGRIRLTAVLVVFVILLIGVIGITVASSGLRSAAESGQPVVVDQFPDRGLGIVGPEWHPGSDEYWEPAFVSSSWGDAGDHIAWDAELAPGVSLSEFDALRLEAWRVTDDHLTIDPSAREPFATADVRRDGRSYSALIDAKSVPGVVHWNLILTGVGSDGVRYVIDASGGGTSTFTGSVWDWVVAVTDDQ
jgi:hypothetical protein